MLRRFSSSRLRLSDGFKSGEIVRLNSVQRRSRGCQARFRPSRASSVRLRLRSRGLSCVRPSSGAAFRRLRFRGRSPGHASCSASWLFNWFMFVISMVSLSSKSVARSAGLRSIRRGRQVGRPFPHVPPVSRRPVARSVQVSPVGFVCISSVRFVPSVRLLPVPVRLLFRSFLFVFVRLSGSFLVLSRSGSPCSCFVSFNLARFSFRFRSFRSLFC